jgi:hypothetical protein
MLDVGIMDWQLLLILGGHGPKRARSTWVESISTFPALASEDYYGSWDVDHAQTTCDRRRSARLRQGLSCKRQLDHKRSTASGNDGYGLHASPKSRLKGRCALCVLMLYQVWSRKEATP